MNNLIGEPEMAKVRKELSAELDKWMKEQGDEGAGTEALALTRQPGRKDRSAKAKEAGKKGKKKRKKE